MFGVDFNIYECPLCGLSFSVNMIEALGKHYEIAEWYGYRWEFGEVLDLIDKKNTKLLEIGCGKGFFLDMAKKRGAVVFGVDINKKAIDFAQKNFGLNNTFAGTIDDFLSGSKEQDFDIVCLFHVIEHLKDPKNFIIKISELVKHNGLLCLSFPNPHRIDLKFLKREHWDYPPHHLTRWNEKSIGYLLKEGCFEVIKTAMEPLSVLKCTESFGTFLQTLLIRRNSKHQRGEDIKGKERFFRLRNILKPVLMGVFLPVGVLLYIAGKISNLKGQAMLVIAKKV
ncbi:MAG: class I SAM-dependent methyltransferase [Proteobacteria bacterium]|nr:class I SAM-dependent methyltransferase [Pseudomonadota bacterium]